MVDSKLKIGIEFQQAQPKDFAVKVDNADKKKVVIGVKQTTTPGEYETQVIKGGDLTFVDPASIKVRGKDGSNDTDCEANKIRSIELNFEHEFQAQILVNLAQVARAARGKHDQKYLGEKKHAADDDADGAGSGKMSLMFHKLKYDHANNATRFKIKTSSSGLNTLILDKTDFSNGTIGFSNVDINHYLDFGKTSPTPADGDEAQKLATNTLWDFDKTLKGVEELETLLKKLTDRYGLLQHRRSPTLTKGPKGDVWTRDGTNQQWLWWNGEDHDLADAPSGELDNLVKDLDKYINAKAVPTTGTADEKEKDQLRHFLFNAKRISDAKEENAKSLYGFEIEKWKSMLEDIKAWRKAGVKKIWELMVVQASQGFADSDIGADATQAATKIWNGVYKGFKLFDGPVVLEKDTTNEVINLPVFKIESGAKIDLKVGIDNLRKLAVRKGGVTTANLAEKFSTKGTVATTSADDSIFADTSRTKRNQLFGFQPGDISATGTFATANATALDLKNEANWKTGFGIPVKNAADNTKTDGTTLGYRTKAMVISQEGPAGGAAPTNLDEAIKPLFFGLVGTNAIHLLDEMDGNKTKNLENYYHWIQNGNTGAYDSAGTTIDTDTKLSGFNIGSSGKLLYVKKEVSTGHAAYNDGHLNLEEDNDTKKFVTAVDDMFDELKKLTLVWDKKGTYGSKANSAQAEVEADKAVVDSFLNTDTDITTTPDDYRKKARVWAAAESAKGGNGVWREELEALQTEIQNRISKGWTDTPTGPTDTEIDAAEEASGVKSELAKKIFETAKSEADLTTEVLDQLKVLAPLLEKVEKNTASYDTDYDKLSKFKSGGTADQKAAWDIANKVKDGNDNYADKMLTKLANQLAAAKTAAKNELGDDVATAIGIDSKGKVSEINAIKDLFAKAKQAWGMANKTETGYEDLKEYLKKAKTKPEWNEVDKYKKDGKGGDSTDGYATGALKRLEGFKDKADEGKKEIEKATTTADARQRWENSPNKDQIDVNEMKGFQINLALKGSDNKKEKELAEVFSTLADPADRFKDTGKDEDLEKIDKVINILKRYKDKTANANGSEEEKTLAKLKAIDTEFGEPKEVINYWLTKLKTQQRALQAAKQARDKTRRSQEPKKNFWTSGWAIATYFVIGAAVIGGLAWWFLKGNEEEEIESE